MHPKVHVELVKLRFGSDAIFCVLCLLRNIDVDGFFVMNFKKENTNTNKESISTPRYPEPINLLFVFSHEWHIQQKQHPSLCFN